MKKTCIECGETFEAKNKQVRFCSRKCIGANRRKNNQIPEETCPVCGKTFIPYRRSVCSRKCATTKKWEDIDFKEKQLKHLQDPNRWTDELKQQVSDSMKVVTSTDEWKENMSKKQLEYWSDDNNKIKRSKCLNYGGRYKWKKYTMPSGKIVKIQGYEDKALNELLQTYEETDLLVSMTDIRNETGPFFYMHNNRKHLYIPDIYIKSEKTIVEVKSKWTYEKNKKINELKKNSVLANGYKFLYLIYD